MVGVQENGGGGFMVERCDIFHVTDTVFPTLTLHQYYMAAP